MTDIIFIHYFGGEGHSWQWVTQYLPKNFKAHCISLPGFGDNPPLKEPDIYEMAEYVLNYARQNGISECILIGHSMGGKIALLSACLSVDIAIEKIILVAPSPLTIENMPEEEKQRMLIRDRDTAQATIEKGTYQNLPPEKMEFAIQTQLQIDDNTWKWWLEKGMNISITEYTDALMTSLFLIYSENDKAITPEMISKEVLPYLNFEKIYRMEKVGHLIPIEKPEYLAKIITDIVAYKILDYQQ